MRAHSVKVCPRCKLVCNLYKFSNGMLRAASMCMIPSIPSHRSSLMMHVLSGRSIAAYP